MTQSNFTWVKTHKEIVERLLHYENKQKELIALLKSVGITPFNDKDHSSEHNIELDEIDPFTFFCYIYKYGSEKRLHYLQEIAKKLGVSVPNDEKGLPSAQAQKVWLFPYKTERKNNEVQRLWNFFKKAVSHELQDRDFEDILKIKSTGKTKLTEALFYINPDKYLPVNGPTKPYIKEVLELENGFTTYSEYVELLEKIREKTRQPFYEISYEAWLWNNERKTVNYWIFQGNPQLFDFETALRQNILTDWNVSAFKDKINVGDKVILWITGNKAGCYALAEITSKPQIKNTSPDSHLWKKEDKANLKAGIKITHNLVDHPIHKERIDKIEELSELKVGNQGTNFSATEEEFEILVEMVNAMRLKKYWLYAPGENAEMWDEFFQLGIMGLGWDELGDLNSYESKEQLVTRLQELEKTEGSKKNDATANYEFKDVMSIGDGVIVKKGRGELLGYGIVTSDYFFDAKRTRYQKCRTVDWKKKGNWKINHQLAIKTLTDITKYESEQADYQYYYEWLLSVMGVALADEKQVEEKFSLNTIFYGPPGTGKTYRTVVRAAEIVENRAIETYSEALQIFKENLHNRIEFIAFHQNYSYEDFIQGLRPDTENDEGLTFKKKDGIFKIIADRAFSNLKLSEKGKDNYNKTVAFQEALEKLKDSIIESDKPVKINDTAYFTAVEDDAFRYSGDNWTLNEKGFNGFRMKYSDLIKFNEENITSRKEIKNLTNVSGLAKQHASYFFKAYEMIKDLIASGKTEKAEVEKQNYVIIIDEINRANISRVFGELITLIDPDKRSHGEIPMEVKLPSGDLFMVPSNLYIIGTMNTADKSIALLDIALRRRFDFEAMYPVYEIKDREIYDPEILQKINEQIIKSKGYDFQIGHAYFMGENKNLVNRMNNKVIPLLLEYFMNDEKEVKSILLKAGLQVEENSWPIKITGSHD